MPGFPVGPGFVGGLEEFRFQWEDVRVHELLEGAEEVEYELVSPGTDRERFLAKMRDYLNRQPDNLALQKVKSGRPLTPADLESLERLLAASGAGSDDDLAAAVSESNGLGRFIRAVVGLDRQAVNEKFAAFLAEINATAQQSERIFRPRFSTNAVRRSG